MGWGGGLVDNLCHPAPGLKTVFLSTLNAQNTKDARDSRPVVLGILKEVCLLRENRNRLMRGGPLSVCLSVCLAVCLAVWLSFLGSHFKGPPISRVF